MADTRPNIIIILADDMGYSDIGCFGSEIRTPNLDALAGGGVVFSQMYNCARCCPTRASLLTGLYPHQAGVGHMVGNRGVREYQGYLRSDCVTIAEALRDGGYSTYLSGKWHVGGPYQPNRPQTWDPGDPGHPIPVQRGFHAHYGLLGGAGSYFDPPCLIRDHTLVGPEASDCYLTDQVSTEAISMIERGVAREQPFFLYLAYTAPHWPLHALPEDISRYRGAYLRGGWDAVREARHEQLLSAGILDPRWSVSPRDDRARPWSDTEHREWEDLRMAVYAAQVDRMDQGIGRVLDALRGLDVWDDTIVFFLSDNGGCAEFLAEDSSTPEPSRYNIPTRDGLPMRVGNVPSIEPGPADTFLSYDLSWANASNTPFRLYKHWVHEGGIATPLIVSWPRKLGGRGRRVVHDPCHVMDLMPTCLDVARSDCPTERQGEPVQPMEGRSILPLLEDRGLEERTLFWEHEGNRAVRRGEWKLVSRYPGQWELYNMERDRIELQDLAGSEPDRVAAMADEYEIWARRCGVLPWPLRP